MTVLVAGAGPAGLMVAGELALAGVEVAVVDRLPARSPFCRGFTLTARSLELLDRRASSTASSPRDRPCPTRCSRTRPDRWT